MTDTKLTPGTYSTQVTYTAVADVPAYGIQQVTPDILSLDQGSTDITIVTTTPVTELGLGDITASIKNSTLGIDLSLTNCSETTVEISGTNYRAATCTYPGGTVEQGGLPVGTYNIELTSSWHASTYTKPNAITVTSPYTISSISPDSWLQFNNGSKTIDITTTIPATASGLGNYSATLVDASDNTNTVSLTSCTDSTASGYYIISCTYPGNAAPGTYNLVLDAPGQNTSYTKASAIMISAESYSITSVSPTTGNNNATTTITMVTNALTSSSTAFGTVTGKIGNTNMSNCTATTSGNYRAVQCTIPSGVTAGTYTVQFTAAGHSNTTYSKASAVTIRAYLTVSGGSGSGWYAPNTTVSITADACSAGYIFNNWTTTGGTIADANAASTTITTGPDNITVTRNCRAKTISDITTMQEITSAICVATPTGTKATLRDTRGSGNAGSGNGNYGVVKAADGNCWMTDNLNLYNKTIAATDSDFTSPTSYTIPAGITATTDWPGGNSFNVPRVEVAHGLGQYATQDQAYWGQVYYNWTAAIAKETISIYTSSDDASICPKGWKLPTNGGPSTDKSWAKLLDSYSITTGAELLANTYLGFSLYYGQWDRNNASENHQGNSGYFWSGTIATYYNAFGLFYSSNTVNPQNSLHKAQGASIRCVAR